MLFLFYFCFIFYQFYFFIYGFANLPNWSPGSNPCFDVSLSPNCVLLIYQSVNEVLFNQLLKRNDHIEQFKNGICRKITGKFWVGHLHTF